MNVAKAALKTDIPMLTDRTFDCLRRLVYQHIGLSWDRSKKELAYTRLRKRLQILNISDFRAYCDYIASDEGASELPKLFDAVTTNHTQFFREPIQLNFVRKTVIPQLQATGGVGGDRKVRVWSAGCSTGEEAYTLAALLLEGLDMDWDMRILASDISSSALQQAKTGRYEGNCTDLLPPGWWSKYFQTIEESDVLFCEARPALREIIQFRYINFFAARYPINTLFDIIFCRNVLIYFNKEDQKKIMCRLRDFLHPGGYLCLGHSETIHDLHMFQKHKFNVFQKIQP